MGRIIAFNDSLLILSLLLLLQPYILICSKIRKRSLFKLAGCTLLKPEVCKGKAMYHLSLKLDMALPRGHFFYFHPKRDVIFWVRPIIWKKNRNPPVLIMLTLFRFIRAQINYQRSRYPKSGQLHALVTHFYAFFVPLQMKNRSCRGSPVFLIFWLCACFRGFNSDILYCEHWMTNLLNSPDVHFSKSL